MTDYPHPIIAREGWPFIGIAFAAALFASPRHVATTPAAWVERAPRTVSHGLCRPCLELHYAGKDVLYVPVHQLGGAVQPRGVLQLGQVEPVLRLLLGRRQVVAGEGVDMGAGHGNLRWRVARHAAVRAR